MPHAGEGVFECKGESPMDGLNLSRTEGLDGRRGDRPPRERATGGSGFDNKTLALNASPVPEARGGREHRRVAKLSAGRMRRSHGSNGLARDHIGLGAFGAAQQRQSPRRQPPGEWLKKGSLFTKKGPFMGRFDQNRVLHCEYGKPYCQ